MFEKSFANWTAFRKLGNLVEVDFHWSGEEPAGDYWENMQAVWDVALKSLVAAQKEGKRYVLFTHGSSTSRIGKTTSRSQVRKLMRSKEATPYIIRRDCIQHDSVFLAAIRKVPEEAAEG